MRNVLRIVAIVAVCFLAGYGIGSLIGKSMKEKENGKGYIGKAEPAIENGVFTPEALLSLGRLSDPQLSPDGSLILYGVSYNSIKDNRSCRNLFVCKSDGTDARQISRYAKSVSCARWSTDGKTVYFIQDGQLWKAPFKGKKLGRKHKLSDIPAGISEFKLSPDQSRILYTSTIKNRLVKQPSDIDPALDKAQAYETEDLMYRHWDHWKTEIPRSYIAPFDGSEITETNSTDILGACPEMIELPTEPFGGIEQLDWSPDGSRIAYSCRRLTGKRYAFSTNTDIYLYDCSEKSTVAVTCGGGYDTDPVWSPDGKRLAWISMERDGYEADRQRLMVADIAGMEVSAVRELTIGFSYDVSGIKWSEDSESIVFPSTINGIGALCAAYLDRPGIERLTPESWLAGFGTPFALASSSDGRSILTTVSSMDFPAALASISLPQQGEPAYEIISHENDHILGQLSPIRTESINIETAQGEKLHCWVLYPSGFDASRKWPVIEMFNGGPQTSLDESWSYRWNFRLMCQQGYVVLLPNRHGDSGFGQAWKEQISGDYQGLNMEDYKLAARWARGQEWCGKVAGVGASYGGFSAYNMMGIHGNLFDCFIAHAGIFNERQQWYSTEEAWFGNWDNGGLKEYSYTEGQTGPAGDGITFGGLQQAGAPYAEVGKSKTHYAFDPESRVKNWHTPILCIHGMKDFRIPYEQGLAAFNAAQMMGVPSKLLVFPEECHWILQPQNALLWHREFFDWLERWTKN